MLVVIKMRAMGNWWIICAVVGLLFAQDFPLRQTLVLELIAVSVPAEGAHDFLLPLDEKLRDSHFLFEVDRSVCLGDLRVNGTKLSGEDAVELLSFAGSNKISLSGCIERTAKPLIVRAVPKVYLAGARVRRSGPRLEIEVTVRNTLPNSATVRVAAVGQDVDFQLGPETSQTQTIFLRLVDRAKSELVVEMWKFPEAVEGAYRHQLKVLLSPH
jgi:hypothetical protein